MCQLHIRRPAGTSHLPKMMGKDCNVLGREAPLGTGTLCVPLWHINTRTPSTFPFSEDNSTALVPLQQLALSTKLCLSASLLLLHGSSLSNQVLYPACSPSSIFQYFIWQQTPALHLTVSMAFRPLPATIPVPVVYRFNMQHQIENLIAIRVKWLRCLTATSCETHFF